MNEVCDTNRLPKNVLETASMIYRNLDGHVEVKGKSVMCMVAATIFMACKQCGVIRTIEEICSEMCIPGEIKPKAKLAAKYYRNIGMAMSQTGTVPVITIDKYISRIANKSRTEPRVARLALDIAKKTSSRNNTDGKPPHGIAAAYLQMSSVLLGYTILPRDIASVAGISETTVRNRSKEILADYKVKIILKPLATTTTT